MNSFRRILTVLSIGLLSLSWGPSARAGAGRKHGSRAGQKEAGPAIDRPLVERVRHRLVHGYADSFFPSEIMATMLLGGNREHILFIHGRTLDPAAWIDQEPIEVIAPDTHNVQAFFAKNIGVRTPHGGAPGLYARFSPTSEEILFTVQDENYKFTLGSEKRKLLDRLFKLPPPTLTTLEKTAVVPTVVVDRWPSSAH